MGHVVNPISFRLGKYKNWRDQWFMKNNYYNMFHKTLWYQKYINSFFFYNKNLEQSSLQISHLQVSHTGLNTRIRIYVYFGLLENYFQNILNQYKSKYQYIVKNQILQISANFFNVLKFILISELKRIEKRNFNVAFFLINNANITASLITRYFIRKLLHGFLVHEIIYPVLKDLKQNRNIQGFRLLCSGRFTRKQRAMIKWNRYKKMPLSTITANIDYSTSSIPLKFGVGAFKLWLYLRKKPSDSSKSIRLL